MGFTEREAYFSIFNSLFSIKKIGFVLGAKPIFQFSTFNSPFKNYPRNPSKIPAATAEPITPATFGPMACISR